MSLSPRWSFLHVGCFEAGKEWRVLECFVRWHLMLPYQTSPLCAGVHLLVDFSGGLFFYDLLWTQQML